MKHWNYTTLVFLYRWVTLGLQSLHRPLHYNILRQGSMDPIFVWYWCRPGPLSRFQQGFRRFPFWECYLQSVIGYQFESFFQHGLVSKKIQLSYGALKQFQNTLNSKIVVFVNVFVNNVLIWGCAIFSGYINVMRLKIKSLKIRLNNSRLTLDYRLFTDFDGFRTLRAKYI